MVSTLPKKSELIELPPFVKEWIRLELRTKGKLRVDVDVYADKDYNRVLYRHGLNFGSDMCFHSLDRKFTMSIDDYIIKLLKYSQKYVKVMINGVLLSDIKLPEEPPVKLPEPVDLSQTGHTEDT